MVQVAEGAHGGVKDGLPVRNQGAHGGFKRRGAAAVEEDDFVIGAASGEYLEIFDDRTETLDVFGIPVAELRQHGRLAHFGAQVGGAGDEQLQVGEIMGIHALYPLALLVAD